MNAAPRPGSVIQLCSATWKVLGTSGLKRGFREVHCRGLSGLVRKTLDAIEENPATEAFRTDDERPLNAPPKEGHQRPRHEEDSDGEESDSRSDQEAHGFSNGALIDPLRDAVRGGGRARTGCGWRRGAREVPARCPRAAKTSQMVPRLCTASTQGGACRDEFTYRMVHQPKASA